MTIDREEANRFVTSLGFFSDLPATDISGLLNNSAIRDYPKGESVFHHGDKADRLFVIMQGWVKLFRTTNEGDEAIVALFTRGDVFGEAAIFAGTGYPFSAQAVEDAQIIEIPAAQLKERAVVNPDITNRIMKSMSREMHKLQMENEHMAIMSAPQRVGCLLLQLSSGMNGAGGTFPFPYDKSLAAARLGMKPETFSRALAQLKSVGVAVKGSEISIESFHCLAEYCCGHCSADLEDCRGARHKEGQCGESGCAGHECPGRKKS